MFKKSLISCFFSSHLILFSQICYADAREDGLQAFKQGQYQLALTHWIPLAKSGDREIQYNLGGDV